MSAEERASIWAPTRPGRRLHGGNPEHFSYKASRTSPIPMSKRWFPGCTAAQLTGC